MKSCDPDYFSIYNSCNGCYWLTPAFAFLIPQKSQTSIRRLPVCLNGSTSLADSGVALRRPFRHFGHNSNSLVINDIITLSYKASRLTEITLK